MRHCLVYSRQSGRLHIVVTGPTFFHVYHHMSIYGVCCVNAAVNACRTMQCPRHKVCLLNIQGLPMCRCPTVYHCRGLERRPVCTVSGNTYRNKCFLRVDECAANRRLRVLHRGPCRSGTGTTGRRSFDAGSPPVSAQHRLVATRNMFIFSLLACT